ncbi:MAG: GNAT family N-acetyltransferase [Candidatus Baltobacteraceae bacterium]
MHTGSSIRRADRGDAQAIARVHVQVWHESFRGMVPDRAIDQHTLESRRANWSEWVVRENWFTHVAEIDRAVVGFACAFPDSAEAGYDAYLNTLYVLQTAQQRGIARALLHAAIKDLRAYGCESMWWLTLKENPACAFYERIGGVVVRDQPAPAELGKDVVDRVFGLPPEAFACFGDHA